MTIYSEVFDSHSAFLHLDNRRLLAFIGRCFHPSAYESGSTIYREGDELQSLMIPTSGIAAFVHQSYSNQIYAFVESKKNDNKRLLQHFGFEDSIVNHLLMIKGLSEKKIGERDVERRADKSFLSLRTFSVQCIVNMEIL